ncbi:pyridoxamine 5'-phosphate oxidase family protein [Paenibacillus thalictri]|uniref:Pyridoxamine 5'-phosphate oxidase family protein n=1 Tax=Paenibacillus thalictri TaxID=2527873 RepID=A0A4Q9E2D3_9BACL|nr:pyridoxamine 5'-phosphate oxidase family protein [Paenibacillus thalictri]TBL81791.1 pyridoxamine 5'-phosphate oxidase family protein [Paenibacillus thalictri]
MRRKEFEVLNEEETSQFLQEMSFGFLGTTGDDGWPLVTPLNFVYHEGAIYFHGSKFGQKMDFLKQRPKVTFSVAKEYAIIPSYFTDPKLACPATAFFKSVLVRGYAVPLEDPREKADALGAFMRKLQPEGGYEPIDPNDKEYLKNLNGVSVVRIEVAELTAKYKFGQNMAEARREKVIDSLVERNTGLDAETAELMRQYCPHHRKPLGD